MIFESFSKKKKKEERRNGGTIKQPETVEELEKQKQIGMKNVKKKIREVEERGYYKRKGRKNLEEEEKKENQLIGIRKENINKLGRSTHCKCTTNSKLLP